MIGKRLPLRGLRDDARGVTILEFGFVAPLLVMTLLALFDLGYRSYASSVLEGALHRAARFATVGDMTQEQIDAYVKREASHFATADNVEVIKKSYSDFSGVNKMEKYRELSSPANTVYDRGVDCYFDDNRNNVRDGAATSGRIGLGGSDDIIFYTVQIRFERTMPLTRMLGWSNWQTVSANTVLRNQPYGTQSFPECKYES
ncbi:TadE family protein [Sphingomonas sp. 1P06PA]|uniref:TadE/TadG family type IV pilus assembly protein n=1 Tax=Sphingomonas sp. 1P06PA TaxID=554121 RepID=UPI0039A6E4D0